MSKSSSKADPSQSRDKKRPPSRRRTAKSQTAAGAPRRRQRKLTRAAITLGQVLAARDFVASAGGIDNAYLILDVSEDLRNNPC